VLPRCSVVSATPGRRRRRSQHSEPARDAFEDGLPVVGLVDDDDVAFGLRAEIERGEHAWQHEDRIGVRPEERARDPAVGVRDFAKVRDVPLDAGQVLEVRRGSEEENVDAFGFHALAELSAGAPGSRTSRDS